MNNRVYSGARNSTENLDTLHLARTMRFSQSCTWTHACAFAYDPR